VDPKNWTIILLPDFANPDLVILLLVYGSLPFSTHPCTLISPEWAKRFISDAQTTPKRLPTALNASMA
jgi:hypothetical protein